MIVRYVHGSERLYNSSLSKSLVADIVWWPRGRHCLVASWPSLSGGHHCLVAIIVWWQSLSGVWWQSLSGVWWLSLSSVWRPSLSDGHHCLVAITVWWYHCLVAIIVWWPSLSGVWWLSLLIITYVYRDTIWWYKPFACLECRLDIKPPVSKPILPGLSITSGRTTRH